MPAAACGSLRSPWPCLVLALIERETAPPPTRNWPLTGWSATSDAPGLPTGSGTRAHACMPTTETTAGPQTICWPRAISRSAGGCAIRALMNWRSAAALSLAALGPSPPTPACCVPKNSGWPGAGAPARALGIALRAAGITAGGQRGIRTARPRRPTCWAGARPGWSTPEPWPISALRCAAPGPGRRAREPLRQGLGPRARLRWPGPGRAGPQRTHHRRRPAAPAGDTRTDALTPSELRVAQMAAEAARQTGKSPRPSSLPSGPWRPT